MISTENMTSSTTRSEINASQIEIKTIENMTSLAIRNEINASQI